MASDALGRLPGQMPSSPRPRDPQRHQADPDPRLTARFLYERGYSIRRIAAFLEVTPPTVWRWIDPANEAKARERVRAVRRRARERAERSRAGRAEEVSAGR